MASARWPLEHGQKTMNRKHPGRFCTFSPVFARFRSFSHFFARFRALGCLFATVCGRPFSHFFAPFACCHLAAAIEIPLMQLMRRDLLGSGTAAALLGLEQPARSESQMSSLILSVGSSPT